MTEYIIQVIGTIFLFGFFAIIGFLAWVSNLGDQRPFNPDWVKEIRTATRGKPKQKRKSPLLARLHSQGSVAFRYVEQRWYRQLRSVPRPLTFLDSEAVVRVLATNARALTPRYIHPYLDFIDGTVQWRVTIT